MGTWNLIKTFLRPCCTPLRWIRTKFWRFSVDASMLLYYGRKKSKQWIQNKLVISAFKMCVLAELLGYVIKFDPYRSVKCGNTTRATNKTWCLRETIVLSLLDVLPQNICYIIFMDKSLLKFLASNNIWASGTTTENTLGNCTITKKKQIDRSKRGRRTITGNELTIVRWRYKKSVYVVSNYDWSEPMSLTVQRSNKDNQNRITV